MSITDPTRRIRVIRVPGGDLPLRLREAFLGLVLECEPACGFADGEFLQCLLRGESARRTVKGFDAPQVQAIAVLQSFKPEAAAELIALGHTQVHKCFFFPLDCAHEVTCPTRQKSIKQIGGCATE